MRTLLITGANGFLGRNLVAHLLPQADTCLHLVDVDTSADELEAGLAVADVVVHLAGVNRPDDPAEFRRGNADFTAALCARLESHGRRPQLILSSSIQAALDNPYGKSKLAAEEVVRGYSRRTGAAISIFRLKNVFGKWCRPNYNSVVATFCHNAARGLPLQVNDPARVLELVYVDDVVAAMMADIANPGLSPDGTVSPDAIPSYRLTLGDLADRLRGFAAMRQTQAAPDFACAFNKQLYATYLSHVPPEQLAYGLDIKSDPRGSLAEFFKSPHGGQIFVSRTEPGVTRGGHFHHTKTEKFLVVEGEAVIRLRPINSREIVEFPVRGDEYRVIDIPPGCTHDITNVGTRPMVTLFWASEPFDPQRPDTYFLPVQPESQA